MHTTYEVLFYVLRFIINEVCFVFLWNLTCETDTVCFVSKEKEQSKLISRFKKDFLENSGL